MKTETETNLKSSDDKIESFRFMKGGKRTGAGRPKGEPTTTIAFRVKSKHVEELKKKIKELINNYSPE